MAVAVVMVGALFVGSIETVFAGEINPPGQRGVAIPAAQAIVMGLRFAVVSAGVNLVALMLLFVPGINAAAFLFANAYLLGREYFLFAATRFMPLSEAYALRERFAFPLFLAGLFIAAFVATPGLNVLTPLFGVAFMSRIYQKLARGAALD